MRLRAPLLAATVGLLGGCSPEPAAQRGAEVFALASFSLSPSNVHTCATCHSTAADGGAPHVYPGYTLHDVTARPTYWGGAYDTLLDAVNECYVEFMRAPTPLAPDNQDGRALLVYLQSISPDPTSPALPLTVVKNIGAACSTSQDCGAQVCNAVAPDGKSTVPCPAMGSGCFCDAPPGDATRGEALWGNSCKTCHGSIHTGIGRLGPSETIVPEESITAHGTDPRKGARGVAIEKIRHGKFFGVGGNMAPYSPEALTDAQIGDLLAYLGL